MDVNNLRQRAESGDVKGICDLAEVLMNHGDFEQSVRWFYEAFETENSSEEKEMLCDTLSRFETLAEGGNLNAQKWMMFFTGDEQKMFYWVQKAAQNGDLESMYTLGTSFVLGQFTPQDYAQAFHWFMQGVNKGDIDCKAALGNCYYHGLGVPRDIDTAKRLWSEAESQGSQEATLNLQKYFRNSSQGKGIGCLGSTIGIIAVFALTVFTNCRDAINRA